MIGRARSWLYVPGHRLPELLGKAMAGPADAVVCDLEDAVPVEAKDAARRHAVEAVRADRPKPLWVRINHPDGPWGAADVAALTGSGADGVRVPKCVHPGTLAQALGVPLHLLVESAEGVENVHALARSHPLVVSVSLGEADLLADLRARTPAALGWARQRIVLANRAAGRASPPHAVWTDLADEAGLIADTHSARDLGFFGRSVLHPSQVEQVNRVFTPDRAEVDAALRLLSSASEQARGGSAAWIGERGRFVDPAVVAGARWLVELAGQLTTETGERHS